MIGAYLGLYTFILLFVWWFFIVAKIHAYKFKNFSYHIEKVTMSLFISLLVLSITWYIMIFFMDTSSFWNDSTEKRNSSSMEEVYY